MSITSESYWGREIVTDALNDFFHRACAHFKSNPLGGGTKGNAAHTTGRHRSREWCLHSAFCTDRTYGTVDKRDRDGNPRYIRACDVKLTPTQMRDVCHRLDKAVRAGHLPQVAEWFGTFDNKTVTGWYEGHKSSSDRSHLEHVHVGVWTKYAGDAEALNEILAVMTGEDMALTDADLKKIGMMVWETDGYIVVPAGLFGPTETEVQGKSLVIKAIQKAVAAQASSESVNAKVDALDFKVDQILAALAAQPPA